MPQMLPYSLELQFVSALIILTCAIVVLACYVLPNLLRQFTARVVLLLA
jgi:hypothetical protein